MIRGVVLDVDDTLYLERDYVLSGFRAVGAWAARELGVVGVAERAWDLFNQGRRRSTLTDALADLGVVPTTELTRTVVGIYRQHTPQIELLSDARLLLDALSCPLAVVTDGPAESQRAKCDRLRLPKRTLLVVTDELGVSKPDRRPFEVVEQVTTLAGPELVYIADNPVKDFQAPLELGWATLRVRRAGSLHVDLGTPTGVPETASLESLARAASRGGVAAVTEGIQHLASGEA